MSILGIDVSKWQGDIDWYLVSKSAAKFAYCRVSDGLTHLDPTFGYNYQGAHEAGLLRGAYQFFRPSQDPIAQANLLLSQVGLIGTRDLPPALDVEVHDGVAPKDIVCAISVWIDKVSWRLGRAPIIYTCIGFWDAYVKSTAFAHLPLWVAHYGVAKPLLPKGWPSWMMWQSASNGVIPGIKGPVDINQYDGTEDSLVAYCRGECR